MNSSRRTLLAAASSLPALAVPALAAQAVELEPPLGPVITETVVSMTEWSPPTKTSSPKWYLPVTKDQFGPLVNNTRTPWESSFELINSQEHFGYFAFIREDAYKRALEHIQG